MSPICDVPWLAEVQAPRAAPIGQLRAPHGPLEPLLRDPMHRAIRSPATWREQRARLRKRWLDWIGTIPNPQRPVPWTVLEQDQRAGCLRQLVRYSPEPGQMAEAYLLRPLPKPVYRVPGVLVLHSTSDHTIRQPAGLADAADHHLGVMLARRGMAAFCPPCYLWRETPRDFRKAGRWLQEHHPACWGMARMLFDARRGIDLLCGVPEVDPHRIGCIGHSLGGKETLYTAAFDERVKAAVASELGLSVWSSNWDAPWYLGPEIRRPGQGLEHHQVLAQVPPRALLILAGGADDGVASWPLIEAVLPVYDVLGVPRRMGMFDHAKGHALPPEARARAFEWLECYLA